MLGNLGPKLIIVRLVQNKDGQANIALAEL